MTTARSGFTLIELSIVITIIALLVGGVVAGRTLLKTADNDIIISERTQFANALSGFKEKYKALPGDMSDAYDFWGPACGTNTTTLSTGCNGNGDGYIISTAGGENVRAWAHMVYSGMVSGPMNNTGTNMGSNNLSLSSTNIMKSRAPDGYWDLTSASGNTLNPTGNVFLRYGGLYTSGNSDMLFGHPKLTHGEAWKIDTKIDDGKANFGRVQGDNGGDCYDSGTDYYNIISVGENYAGDCILTFMFLQQF